MVILEHRDLFIDLCQQRDSGLISWTDVMDEMNRVLGKSYSKDKFRKEWYSFKQGMEYQREIMSDSNIEDKIVEFEIERKKKQTAAIEYNKIFREESRRQMLFDEFKRAVKEVEPPKFKSLPFNNGKTKAVLGFADIHYGKSFKSINNEYNESVTIKRMEQIMSETIEYCRKFDIDDLHVVNNGDSVEGMSLRISQLKTLQLGFVDQVLRSERLIVEWLNELSKYVKITYHHTKSSNHSEIRPLGTSRGDFPLEDMERLISAYIHDMLLKNDRIDVPYYENEYCRFKIFEYLFYCIHGHQIRNIKTSLKDLSDRHGEFIDYLILGHFHHFEEMSVGQGNTNNRSVIVLPSVMGSDDYSDTLFTGSKAGASIFLIDDKVGKRSTWDIIL